MKDICSAQEIAEASCDGDIIKCGNACHKQVNFVSFDTRPYMKRLKAAQQNNDIESAHADADQVLCDLL